MSSAEPVEFNALREGVMRAEREFYKRIRDPGDDRMNPSVGTTVRSKLCPPLIAVVGKGLRAEGVPAAASPCHVWDWVESYSDAACSDESFEAMKASISSLNSSAFKDDKNRKLRTFFCHALK